MSEPAVLQVSSLGKSYGRTSVLVDVNVSLERGERLGLSGPNGSGKSTLLRCIAGALIPSTGRVTVGGQPVGTPEAARLVGASTAHEKAFYQRLSGARNLEFFASLRARNRREAIERVGAIVDELEIGAFIDDRVAAYSSGMAQQLGIARALVGDPALLLLDEPTRSLDHAATTRFWDAIERRPETCVVIASHHEDDLSRCPRRLDLT